MIMISNKNIASLTSLTPDPAMNQQSITVEVVMVGRGRAESKSLTRALLLGTTTRIFPEILSHYPRKQG